jgi:diguanylate cyclase (GGDEF)-like protein
MDDDELELKILEAYVGHWERVETEAQGDPTSKCVRELDMHDVLGGITDGGADLGIRARLWHGRLSGQITYDAARPLRPCSDGSLVREAHRYHARAYNESGRWPAWDRIRELRGIVAAKRPALGVKEREQKFGILLSAKQVERDFEEWQASGVGIGVLFIDIDGFKALNGRHTETTIDQTLLPEAMRLLDGLVCWRGGAYRQGGEEFVILLPNHTVEEVNAFAERIRDAFDTRSFTVGGTEERVTVSIGVATAPTDGNSLRGILQAANDAERRAKSLGGNRVERAGPGRHRSDASG